MKIEISVPDGTYDRAAALAKELGISRSEFFAQAAETYIADLGASGLTARINQALRAASTDESASAAATDGRRRLASEADW